MFQHFNHLLKIPQVFKRIIRFMALQFFKAGVAGGNGNRCHAVGFAAFHIVGRIADDHNILAAEEYAAVFRCTIDRDSTSSERTRESLPKAPKVK